MHNKTLIVLVAFILSGAKNWATAEDSCVKTVINATKDKSILPADLKEFPPALHLSLDADAEGNLVLVTNKKFVVDRNHYPTAFRDIKVADISSIQLVADSEKNPSYIIALKNGEHFELGPASSRQTFAVNRLIKTSQDRFIRLQEPSVVEELTLGPATSEDTPRALTVRPLYTQADGRGIDLVKLVQHGEIKNTSAATAISSGTRHAVVAAHENGLVVYPDTDANQSYLVRPSITYTYGDSLEISSVKQIGIHLIGVTKSGKFISLNSSAMLVPRNSPTPMASVESVVTANADKDLKHGFLRIESDPVSPNNFTVVNSKGEKQSFRVAANGQVLVNRVSH